MQEKKNSCSLAGLLANFPNEPDSFRQQLAEAITAYLRVESSDEKKKKQKAEKIRQIFLHTPSSSNDSEHSLDDIQGAYYLELVNLVFGEIAKPSEVAENQSLCDFIKKTIQPKLKIALITLSADLLVWEHALKVSLDTSKPLPFTTPLKKEINYFNTFELAYDLNKKVLSVSDNKQGEDTIYEERLALRYLGKVEEKIDKEPALLGQLLPLASCRSDTIQGALLELGLKLLEDMPDQRWLVYYWLADVLRLGLGAEANIPQSMLLRVFIILLDQLPAKDENIAKDIVFLYETTDKKELLAYFDLLQTVLEAAHSMGITKIYDALKLTLTQRLAYLQTRGKEVKKNVILDNQITLLEKLQLNFKDDKTLGEKIKIFASPILRLSLGSLALGMSATEIGASQGADVEAYLRAVSALVEIGKSLQTLYKLIPTSQAHWYQQYRHLQELIYPMLTVNKPWLWYVVQQSVTAKLPTYHEEALIQLMNLFARLCAFKPDLYLHFQPIIQACCAQRTYHQENLVIQALVLLCIYDKDMKKETIDATIAEIKGKDYKVALHKIKNMVKHTFHRDYQKNYEEKLDQQKDLVEEQIGQYTCAVTKYGNWIQLNVMNKATVKDVLLNEVLNEINPMREILQRMKHNALSASTKLKNLPPHFIKPLVLIDNKAKRVSHAFNDFLQTKDKQVLLVTGEPLSGKESTLQWLAQECWLSDYIPIVIPVTRDEQISNQYIYDILKNEYGLDTNFREQLKENKLLFIIHSIDKVVGLKHPEFYRHFGFSNWPTEIKVVFCCSASYLSKQQAQSQTWENSFANKKSDLKIWYTKPLTVKKLETETSFGAMYLLSRAYDLKDEILENKTLKAKALYDAKVIKQYRDHILPLAISVFADKKSVTWGELKLLADVVIEKLVSAKNEEERDQVFEAIDEIKLLINPTIKTNEENKMQENSENKKESSDFSLTVGDTNKKTGVKGDPSRAFDSTWQPTITSSINKVLDTPENKPSQSYDKHLNALKGMQEMGLLAQKDKSGTFKLGDTREDIGLDLTGTSSSSTDEKSQTLNPHASST